MNFFKKTENSGKNLARKILHIILLAYGIYMAYSRLQRIFYYHDELHFIIMGLIGWPLICSLIYFPLKNIYTWIFIHPISVNGFDPIFKKKEIEHFFEGEDFIKPPIFANTSINVYESQNWICIRGHFLKKNESIIIREDWHSIKGGSVTTLYIIHSNGMEEHFNTYNYSYLYRIGYLEIFQEYLKEKTKAKLILSSFPLKNSKKIKKEIKKILNESNNKKKLILSNKIKDKISIKRI